MNKTLRLWYRGGRLGLRFFLAGALLGAPACGEMGAPGENGESGDRGEKGDKGDPGKVDPALGLLTPSTLFAGRSAVLQVSGVGTSFAPGSLIDFGDPAIKATKIEIGSNANLRVTVDVGLDARLGLHDVRVATAKPDGSGNLDLWLKGGLVVSPSLSVEADPMSPMMAAGPTAPQGGFVEVAAKNQDFRENPLGTGLRLGAPLSFISQTSLTAARVQVVALVDALAPAGALRTTLWTTNPLGQSIGFVADPTDALAVKVTARSATSLGLGAPKNAETLPARRSTNLYKITTTADNQVVQVVFGGLGMGLVAGNGPRLIGYMAPATGVFRDGRIVETSATPAMMAGWVSARTALVHVPKAGAFFLSVYSSDFTGSMNHTYSVTPRAATAGALGSLKEPMMGDTPMAPVTNLAELDKPYVGTDGAIDANYEYDYIKLKAKNNGRVYVTVTSTPGVSIGLGVRGPDCNAGFVAAASFSASGAVANEFEAKAGDTYCVRVYGDTAGTTPYQLVISPAL